MAIENLQDLLAALRIIRPELLLTGFAILCILVDLLGSQTDKFACWVVSGLGIATAFAATMVSWGEGQAGIAFFGLVCMDNLALFFNMIFLLAGLVVLLLSVGFVRREGLPAGEFCALVLICLVGMTFMAGANDLMTVFLGLEIMSIPVYVMSGMLRQNAKSPEAAIKYLLLGAFASAFLLFGIVFIYGSVGSTNLEKVLAYVPVAVASKDLFFLAGMGFLLVGMGFKVSLVPFHMWTPDVYEGAPTPVTALMSVGVKAAGFAILIRVIVISMNPLSFEWSDIFWWLAVVTMVIGNVVALVQENIKRMLAYSSIAHAGYVLVALTTGTATGIQSALIYLFIYTVMNLGAFGVVIGLTRKGDEGTMIRDYSGLARRHPLYALAMAVFMFSLAGVPPTGGFIGKFYVFSAAVNADYVGLAIIGVLMSAVSAYFYLRVLVVMYMQEPEEEETEATLPVRLCDSDLDKLGLNVSLVFCALSVLCLGIWPKWLSQVADSAVQGIFPLF